MARKGIKYGTIILVVMALIPGTVGLLKKVYLILNPPPPPPPTVRYGKLPQLNWPMNPNPASPEYKLETISGGLPGNLPNVGKVYVVGINKSRLMTLDRMSARAQAVGFVSDPVQLDERTYRYVNTKAPVDMIFDVISGSFSYKLDWTKAGSAGTFFDVPIGEGAIAEAKSFLQRLGQLPTDLEKGQGKVRYLTATGSAMLPAASAYEANFTRVDLFRDKKDDLDVVTVGGNTSSVNVVMSGQSGVNRVVQANFAYSQTVDNDFATYPLRPVQQAWNDLLAGKSFIAIRTSENTITIRNIKLGYFESNDPQEYLQPVYVFEGDLGFIAYVPAVSSDYMTE